MKLRSTYTAPVLVIIVMLLLAASRRLDLNALSYQDNISLAVVVLQILILIVPSAFYMRMRGESFTARLRIKPVGGEKLLASLLCALTIVSGSALLKLFLYNIGLIDGEFSVWRSFLGSSETNIVYSLLTFCVIPAIAEELLFRGILCVEYEENGAVTAIILSAGLYAMFGMDIGYFPILFFRGLGFALLYYMTRSVLTPMLCHFMVEVAELVIDETVWNIIMKPHSTVFLIFALAGIFLLCLGGLFSECERLYYGYALRNVSSEELGKQTGGTFLKSLLAPPYLLAALVFILAVIGF